MAANVIEYGNGEVSIKIGSDIVGIDILLSGTYELESYDVPNLLISYNNNRIIGVCLGGTLGISPFLKYTGDLRILRCHAINTAMEKVVLIASYRSDLFIIILDDFDNIHTKFEDLNVTNVYGKIPEFTKVELITKNLHTKGDEYTLNGKDYSGYYHLHHTGVVMTGAEHDESSETLEIKNKIQHIKRISESIKTIRKASATGGRY